MIKISRVEKRPFKPMKKRESIFKPIAHKTVKPLSGASARSARRKPKE